MIESFGSRVPAADWEATPESVKAVVEELSERFEHLSAQFKALSEEISPLSAQVQQLEKKVLLKSSGSTKFLATKGFGDRTNHKKRRSKR